MDTSARPAPVLAQSSEYLGLAHDLALGLGEAETLDEALGLVVRRVCESTGWDLGQAWLPTPDGAKLRSSQAWFAATPGLEPFRKVSEMLVFEPGAGLPGRVFASKRPAWIDDVTLDDNFPRAPVAAEVGFVAGMATPVIADGDVAAVLEFFVRERQEEDAHLLDLISMIAAELGILVRRRRAEEALRASEERFRTVAETANDAIVSAGADGVLTYANAAAERLFGYPGSELAGLPLHVLMPERYRERHANGLRRYVETGEGTILGGPPVELAALRKDGREVPIEISLASWRGEDGPHFTGVIRDITERKEAEAAIRRNEARLEEAQRLAHIGSWEWDVANDAVTWSHELYRIFGLTPAEFTPTYDGYIERVDEADRGRVQAVIQEAFATCGSFEFDHRVARPDGDVRIIHSRGAVTVGPDGAPIRMAGTAQDVTEQRRAEEELRRIDDLKSRFIADAAHELRSPLTVIVGMASVLARNRDRMEPDAVADGFASMERQGRRILELVENLLDLSRLEHDRTVAVEPVELLPTLGRALSASPRPGAGRVETNVPVGLAVMAAPELLERVLSNLLLNAYRYGGDHIAISARPDGEHVVVSVEDDGPGVSAELVPRLFEPFARGSHAADIGGSGLGLAISKRIVDSLGGTITYRAADPQGARFDVRLPAT